MQRAKKNCLPKTSQIDPYYNPDNHNITASTYALPWSDSTILIQVSKNVLSGEFKVEARNGSCILDKSIAEPAIVDSLKHQINIFHDSLKMATSWQPTKKASSFRLSFLSKYS